MSEKEHGPEEQGSLSNIASLVESASPQGISDIIDSTRKQLAADSRKTLEAYREGGLEKVAAGKWQQIKDVGSGVGKTIGSVAKSTETAASSTKMGFVAAFGSVIALVAAGRYYYNPYGVSTHMPAMSALLILFLGLLLSVGYTWLNANESTRAGRRSEPADAVYGFLWQTMVVFGITIFLFVLVVFIASIVASFSLGVEAFKYTLVGMMVFIVLTMLVAWVPAIRAATKSDEPTINKLLGLLFFYIPCLFLDFVIAAKKEYGMTESDVIILLGIEMLLLALYFGVPLVLNWIVRLEGSLILREPMYLDKAAAHGDVATLYNAIKRDGQYDFTKADRYVYSISAWFRINPQPPSGREAFSQDANILTFGDRPKITYNNSTRMLRVACKLDENRVVTIYKSDQIPLQTWNNIVINSDGGSMTTFINGTLVGSKINIAPLTRYDLVVTGQDKGLEGGITTIQFRRRILSPLEIDMAYKALGTLPSPQI